MLTVIICTLFNTATLVALLAGIVVGVVEARVAIADALAFDTLAVTRRAPARSRAAMPA